MKNVFTLSIFCLFATSLFAQPTIEWQRSYGGFKNELSQAFSPAPDGGYFVAGYANSTDGDVTENKGQSDAWALKLNAASDIIWQKTLGGSRDDEFNALCPTSDGGCIFAGRSLSSDGDMAGNPTGTQFAWVVKMTENGTVAWQKAFANSGYAGVTSVQQTTDGGYILGVNISVNNAVTSLIKLDTIGEVLWEMSMDSLGFSPRHIEQTGDGGYIVAGDKYSAMAADDIMAARLSASGSVIWSIVLGGTQNEQASDVQELADGGFIIAGNTGSGDGDVTLNYGQTDCWVIRLDEAGSIVWKRNYGGSSYDSAKSVKQTADGGFIMLSESFSNDYDVLIHYFGGSDLWLTKLTPSGDIIWETTLGGENFEFPGDVLQTNDGGYILIASTASTDSDVLFNHGNYDVWLVKLSAVVAAHEPFAAEALSLSPNPAHDIVSLQTPAGTEVVHVDISDVAGQTVLSQNMPGNNQVNISGLHPGMYLVKAKSTSGELFANRLIKQ